jgi:hypothetical protein
MGLRYHLVTRSEYWIPSTHAKKKSTILQEHWRGRRHWKTRKGVKLYAINITKLKHNKYHLGSWKKNRNSWGIQLRKNHPKSRFFFLLLALSALATTYRAYRLEKKFLTKGRDAPWLFHLRSWCRDSNPGWPSRPLLWRVRLTSRTVRVLAYRLENNKN